VLGQLLADAADPGLKVGAFWLPASTATVPLSFMTRAKLAHDRAAALQVVDPRSRQIACWRGASESNVQTGTPFSTALSIAPVQHLGVGATDRDPVHALGRELLAELAAAAHLAFGRAPVDLDVHASFSESSLGRPRRPVRAARKHGLLWTLGDTPITYDFSSARPAEAVKAATAVRPSAANRNEEALTHG